MGTLMSTVDQIIRETIDQGIDDTLPKLDPVVSETVKSSLGVVRSGIGRGWTVKHAFSGSLAGSHHYTSGLANGPNASYDTNEATVVYGTGNTWPGLSEMTAPTFFQSSISLVQGRGNFPVPMHLLQSDSLDASVGSAVAEIVRGAAKRTALARVHSFWKLDVNNNIGTFTGPGSTVNGSGTIESVTLNTGRIRSFFPGLLVDLATDADHTTRVNNDTDDTAGNYVVIRSVDYVRRKIYFSMTTTSASQVSMGSSTVYVRPRVHAGTNVPNGLENWIKVPDGAGANSVFGITLDTFPQFSSIIDSTLSGPCTSDILNKYIGGFEEAYGAELDTLIWTTGTMLGFLENLDDTSQLIRYPVQGQALSVKAGFQGFGYVYGGRALRVMTSPNCPVGTVYAIKLGDQNLKRYVPPKLPKGRADGRFPGEVEFVGQQLGSNSIFMPLYSSSAVTDVLQAPYIEWCQFAARMPQGIKLSTFAENLYAG